MAKRIQRKRTKGWRMPPNAVYVGRPTIFGNPWTYQATLVTNLFRREAITAVLFNEYKQWLLRGESPYGEHLGFWRELEHRRDELIAALPTLRGKDLACWCPLSEPCHADILLELANA